MATERAQPSEPWRLDGRVALVTGAARGIGAAIALRLAGLGASLVLADRTPSVQSDPAAAALRAVEGDRVSWQSLDVRDDESCQAVVAHVVETHGRLDVLVNNAGVNARRDVADTTEPEWTDVLDVNLNGTYRMCRAAMPLLRRSPAAAVVNLGSTAGAVAVAGAAAYGVSKAAVMHLTRILAVEWARDGIRVNAVAPTIVPTEMTADVQRSAAYMEDKLASIPLRRMAGRDDVANAVAFLCSDAAAMTTGHVLFVDGGATVQ